MNDDRVYEELGRNYRFFATWRHLTFAAGAGVWVGVMKIGSDKGLASQGFALAAFVGAVVRSFFSSWTPALALIPKQQSNRVPSSKVLRRGSSAAFKQEAAPSRTRLR